MKAVLQRVKRASVAVDGTTVGEIQAGLLVFLGVMKGDTQTQAAVLANKIAPMRIFLDENDKMNLSVDQIGGAVLLIPNFTLGADCSHGRRPYFSGAAPPSEAEPLFLQFGELLSGQLCKPIQSGVFGAEMEISATLWGPVTICLDTAEWQ